MAYAATAGGSLPSMTAAPGVLALQRAMVWLVGASGAIVFIEPSPYELATLAEIGALNAFGHDRRSALWQIERAARPAGELVKGQDVVLSACPFYLTPAIATVSITSSYASFASSPSFSSPGTRVPNHW